jgi:hypothetical protein
MRLGQNRRRGRRQRQRDGGHRGAGDRDAQQAAGQTKDQHLQDVHRDDLRAARTDAFENGNAADFLQDEHPGDARHRDAAQDDDDEPHQAQVILGAIEIAADLVLARAVRPRVDEVLAQVTPERGHQVRDPTVRHANEHQSLGTAAKRQQTRRRQVGIVNVDPRAEAESAGSAARLSRDDATDGEHRLADGNLIAHLELKRGKQLRTHQRTVLLQQRMRVGLAALQQDRAVEGIRGLDGAQLRHLGNARRRVGRPHIVGVSVVSVRANAPAVARWRSIFCRASSGQSRVVLITTSAPTSALASELTTPRTLWMTDRSATMAATPTAMQTKKNSRRRHDARVSRTAMRRTNIIGLAAAGAHLPALAPRRRSGRP